MMIQVGQLLGKPRTPIRKLFSNKNGDGWIDKINSEFYPTLDEMVDQAKVFSNLQGLNFNELGFEFPQSLDDFGLVNYFNNKYNEYLCQWVSTDEEVQRQQNDIQHKYLHLFPKNSFFSLYLMVSEKSGTDRVVYVGIARSGLMMRFMNGATIRPQNNNYIGDCRSVDSPKNPHYTWRAKSAELRRRGVYKLVWTILDDLILDEVEKNLIVYKLKHIEKQSNFSDLRDPVNR